MKSPNKALVSDKLVLRPPIMSLYSISKVTKDGKGVLSVNLNLAKLAELVKKVKIGTQGYIYIFDRNSKFLVLHPKNAAAVKRNTLREMLTKDKEF